MIITKHFRITNFCEYTEVDSPLDTPTGESSKIKTVMGGHNVTIETIINDNGKGVEKRTFDVKH